MGAGAGQRGGVPQSTPQVTQQAMPPMRPMMPGGDQQGIAALMRALQQRQAMNPSMSPMQPGMPVGGGIGAAMAPSAGMTLPPQASSGLPGKGAGMPQGPMPQNPMAQSRPFDPRLAMLLRRR
jgi:hypothetical protein